MQLQKRPRRKTKADLMNEQKAEVESRLLIDSDDGLKLKEVKVVGKGRGVVATKDFKKNDFLVEYAGDLISLKEAKEREAQYIRNQLPGGYLYYFRSHEKPYCIDATAETDRLGKPTKINNIH
jgi:histone-lysine N-methyltransferase SETD8